MGNKKVKKLPASKKSKNTKKIYASKTVFIAIIILAILLIIALLVELQIITNPIENFNKKAERVEAVDACSLIAGRLIHTINDEGSCRNICIARCDALEKVFESSEFTQRQNACNDCSCYCK